MNLATLRRPASASSRSRRRERTGPLNGGGLLDAALLRQLEAAGIASETLVAVRAASGEWLLLQQPPAAPSAVPTAVPTAAPSAAFDDAAFANAVRAALDDLHLTHRLLGNPLLECAVVQSRSPSASARLGTLRDWLRGTNERLSRNPATARAARILHRTYFEPARSQQLAAEALGLGYSTYRRLLAEARALLIAELRLA